MRLGRRSEFGRVGLTPEQRRTLQRLERGEIDAVEAERLLCGDGVPSALSHDEPEVSRPDETPEEAAARELVERTARDAYRDSGL